MGSFLWRGSDNRKLFNHLSESEKIQFKEERRQAREIGEEIFPDAPNSTESKRDRLIAGIVAIVIILATLLILLL